MNVSLPNPSAMARVTLTLAMLLFATILHAQPWSISLPNAHGAGPAALPLANGDVLLHSALSSHLLRVDNMGATVWGAALPALGTFAAVAEQPNGDLVAVTYLDDPNGSIAAFPAIVRLSGSGQFLGGIRYAQDSTWALRRAQVVNADNGHYFVLYNGDNAHRIAYFNAADAEQWTHEFTGLGFAMHATWVSGDGLHAFNGPLHFLLTTGGQVAWESYLQPTAGGLDVGAAYWDGTRLVAAIRYVPSPGVALPGVAHLNLLGNVLDAVLFTGLDSTAQENMAIAPMATGSMVVNGDLQGRLHLYTCDAQLANAAAFEAPLTPLWPGIAYGTAANGLAWGATDGDLFTGARVATHMGADGNVGGCLAPVTVVPGTLPTLSSIPNPFPITTTTPTLLPAPVNATPIPYIPVISPLCAPVKVNEQTPLRAEVRMQVFPNPAHDRITLTSNSRMQRVRIVALDGRTVLEQRVAGERAELELTGLAAGAYSLQVVNENGEQVVRSLAVL
ncbi:MAG: T9SS type A sorting domain-containing protein [Flavobacteriales bacterium]|nr:T9SS type A sorting domain-containing protein [Flavobacteriales bacterium]